MTGRVYQRDKSRRDVWQPIIEHGRPENSRSGPDEPRARG
jgi:hypothetical protein